MGDVAREGTAQARSVQWHMPSRCSLSCPSHQWPPAEVPRAACICLGGKRCAYDLVAGSFGDFARPIEATGGPNAGKNPNPTSTTCTTGADCVPPGIQLCRPPLFKVRAKAMVDATNNVKHQFTHAWDLHWDPDEKRNLLKDANGAGSNYFGIANEQDSQVTMIDRIDDCLEDYWHLKDQPGQPGHDRWESPSEWRPAPGTTCPSTWAEP